MLFLSSSPFSDASLWCIHRHVPRSVSLLSVSVFPSSSLLRQHPTPHLQPLSLPPLSLLPSSLFPCPPFFILQRTSANLTPIFSLFNILPSPPHYTSLLGLFFFSASSFPAPLSHFRDDAWLHISVSLKQPHACVPHAHTHLFPVNALNVHNVILKVNSWGANVERVPGLKISRHGHLYSTLISEFIRGIVDHV